MKKFTNIIVVTLLSFVFSFANAQTNLFFSEWAEGSSYNKYFEVYNPTSDTVDLSNYAYPSVANAPSTPGTYEYWNDFDSGAVILPYGVYVVAHPSSDASILAEADETHPYLSNGDDGYALVYGAAPSSPTDPATGGYTILDWIGNWDGDPGSGWGVAGVSNGTKDHTIVRKCDVTSGNTDWTVSAGTDSLDSEWIVYPQNEWTYLGSHVTCPLPPTTFISYCSEFTSGPAAWPHVLVATTASQGAVSQGAQTFTMNVTSLPTGGANFRVFKTTANGGNFFGNAQTLTLGINTITVSAVGFDRAVKFQFSNGGVGFDALSLNGVATSCLPLPPPPSNSLISACNEFAAGPAAWPHVLVAATASQGAVSQGAQTFTMNVTSLPAGGASYRVYKTTANGSDFFGNPQTMTLGINTITVSAVGFDRAVKFQFSDGSVEFNALSLNGVNSGCVAPPATYTLTMDDSYGDGWNGATWTATSTSTGTVFGPFTVNGPYPTGVQSIETFSSADNCFTVVVTGGSWPGEISWTLDSAGTNLFTNEVAPYSGSWGSCTYGCTDPAYGNYDASADFDDGSCTNNYTLTMNDSYGDGWNGATWTATSTSTGTVFGPFTVNGPYPTGVQSIETFSSADDCFTVVVTGGSWPSEISWTLDKNGTNLFLDEVAPYTGSYGTCIFGCADSTANNYDPNADVDDGTCAYGACTVAAPTHETFSTGLLPIGTCVPNQWAISATSGDGWRFLGTPGYGAASNGRTAGTYAWVDFSSIDAGVVMEVEDVDVSALTTPTVIFDYFSYYNGTVNPLNLLYVEGFNGTSWVSIDSLQINIAGWNTYSYPLTGALNGTIAEVRFRAESGGASNDYYNDLLLDDVKIMEAPVPGCMDTNATNYDPLAAIDDGSCTYISGCTNSFADNYNPLAYLDNDSCTYANCSNYTLYMADSYGDSWNGNTFEVFGSNGYSYGSFTVLGSYPTATADTAALCLPDDCFTVTVGGGTYMNEISWTLVDDLGGGTVLSGAGAFGNAPVNQSFCAPTVYGCMDVLACNYDSLANIDDASCTYGETFTVNLYDSYGDGWNGNTLVLTDTSGTEILNTTITTPYPNGTTGSAVFCTDVLSSCYTVTCGGGSWQGEVSWEIVNDTGAIILSGGAPFNGDFGNCVYGCTDPTAFNYDPNVTVEDGSCVPVILGCTDSTQFNYDPLANTIFGCIPFVYGCIDTNAVNFSLVANTDDGTCDYSGCTDQQASNYDPAADIDDGTCTYATTFNVDMGCQVPGSFTSVSVESANLSCNGGCITLSDPDGDDVWSVTLDLLAGSYVYKYAIDNNSSQENLVDDVLNGNASCAPYTDFFSYANREVIVSTPSTTNDTYGSCDPCIRGCMDIAANNYDSLANIDNGTCEYDVTFVVDMTCSGLSPTMVAATGYADNWSANTYVLSDPDGDGIWEGTYSVTDNFVYMYAVDNYATSEYLGLLSELQNGTNSCAPFTDGISYAYRMAAAPSTTSDIYGQCSSCPPGCTDPAATNYNSAAQIDDGSCVYATTFNVDMNCEPAGSFGFVHLESPFFNWCGGCVQLADPDGDGVHSVTIDLPLGNFEYKYAVDYWAGQENLIDDMVNGATCAPITDYANYANRLVDVTAGTILEDTYGSCDTCDQQYGCTDNSAVNFDSFATTDDGSCLYSTTFNVDMRCEPAGSFGYVHLESPAFSWCGGCVPMSDPDGDGVHSVTVDLPAGNFEYKYAVDGFAGQEDLIDDMVNGASCAPVTDYFSYANRLLDVNGVNIISSNVLTNGDFSNGLNSWNTSGTGWAEINGAADLWSQTGGGVSELYQNWSNGSHPLVVGKTYRLTLDAVVNSGSCVFSQSNTPLLTIDNSQTYVLDFVCTNVNVIFSADGLSSADLSIDNISIVEIEYENAPNQEDTYGSCSECILGCMDSLAFNYNDSALVDDGSCLYGYNCPAPYPIGLSSSDIYAEMATIHWADANSGSCRVWKYFVRYREVGTLVWTTKSAGAGSGLCNVGLPNTSKVLRNLSPSTTYEFKMKAFYCGGGESGYSFVDTFTTLPACPPMTNLAVQTFSSNHGKAKFTWNETGPYTFARIALRVNTAGSSWQTAGGFGVNYPQFSVLKFGLTGGTEYRAQGRTFCDPVVTSYRSTWTAPIVWTQPGVAPIRLDGGTAINNLEVYPNPSKDVFNVSFVSEDVQNLEVRVLNLIGEVIYTEGLEQFVGEYTKSINLSKYTKGVYFLEITTKEGVVNKKIVLQ